MTSRLGKADKFICNSYIENLDTLGKLRLFKLLYYIIIRKEAVVAELEVKQQHSLEGTK
jgi:hypothetical protein